MSRRSVRSIAVVGVAAAAAVLAGSASATADPGDRPESAFALAGQGLLNFGPLTRIAAPDGNQAHTEVVGLASVPGLAKAGITGGLLTADAHTGYAATTVADLRMAQLLSADVVKTTCENGHGKVEIGNGALLGTALPQFPVRGQTLDLTVVKATFGEEKRNADGTITVTGVKVTVLPAGALPAAAGLPAITNIAYVTADEPDDGSDDSGDSTDTSEDPTPVEPPKPRPATSAPAVPRSTSAAPAPVVPPIPSDVNALPGLPNLPLPELVPGQPAQTITIGSATCGADDDQKPLGRPAGAGGQQASTGEEDEPSVDDVDDAPAPEVVQADLPVTG